MENKQRLTVCEKYFGLDIGIRMNHSMLLCDDTVCIRGDTVKKLAEIA